jgi:hypothetical protein
MIIAEADCLTEEILCAISYRSKANGCILQQQRMNGCYMCAQWCQIIQLKDYSMNRSQNSDICRYYQVKWALYNLGAE